MFNNANILKKILKPKLFYKFALYLKLNDTLIS